MTKQTQERMILDGIETEMVGFPYFPEEDPRIIKISEELAELYKTTACYRNYIGTWEIKNRKLYLIKLEGKYRLKKGMDYYLLKKYLQIGIVEQLLYQMVNV
jgi:hypothetical protein